MNAVAARASQIRSTSRARRSGAVGSRAASASGGDVGLRRRAPHHDGGAGDPARCRRRRRGRRRPSRGVPTGRCARRSSRWCTAGRPRRARGRWPAPNRTRPAGCPSSPPNARLASGSSAVSCWAYQCSARAEEVGQVPVAHRRRGRVGGEGLFAELAQRFQQPVAGDPVGAGFGDHHRPVDQRRQQIDHIQRVQRVHAAHRFGVGRARSCRRTPTAARTGTAARPRGAARST